MGCYQSTLTESSVVKFTSKPLNEVYYSNPVKTNTNFKSVKLIKDGVFT